MANHGDTASARRISARNGQNVEITSVPNMTGPMPMAHLSTSTEERAVITTPRSNGEYTVVVEIRGAFLRARMWKVMRGRRSTSASPARSTCSSWIWLALVALVASQLVTFYLLLSLMNKRGSQQDCSQPQWLDACDQHFPGVCETLSAVHRSRDRVLSVRPTSVKICEPRVVSAGRCGERGSMHRPEDLRLRSCTHSLFETDIVFGVWHSLATESRLKPLLDTWGKTAPVVLLASSIGFRESKLFQGGGLSSNHNLMDTGVKQDDYFSTLGKAFIGLRLMLELYPDAKWFVVLGDDNYVLLENYINVLSAFDPNEPWALSRMVHRDKFGFKVAGGASVITSRALTQGLAPHLESWYQGILERSGGNVNKASEADKFHDIAFQKLVESNGYSWVHLDELPHEPPGYLLRTRYGVPTVNIPDKSALFHYVPGGYMHYLHFVSSQACTCVFRADDNEALQKVAVGVYSSSRRLSKLDEKRIASTWGKEVPLRANLASSGRDFVGIKGDIARLHELTNAFPQAGWLLLLPVEHYLVAANLAVRIRKLDADSSAGRGVIVHGPSSVEGIRGSFAGEGAVLVGMDLTNTIFRFEAGLLGGMFPFAFGQNDRGIEAWARTLSSMTVLQDAGFVRQTSSPLQRDGEIELEGVGCPATFPMEPDLSGLKPEFTLSEGEAVMHITRYLLQATSDTECAATLRSPRH